MLLLFYVWIHLWGQRKRRWSWPTALTRNQPKNSVFMNVCLLYIDIMWDGLGHMSAHTTMSDIRLQTSEAALFDIAPYWPLSCSAAHRNKTSLLIIIIIALTYTLVCTSLWGSMCKIICNVASVAPVPTMLSHYFPHEVFYISQALREEPRTNHYLLTLTFSSCQMSWRRCHPRFHNRVAGSSNIILYHFEMILKWWIV